MLLRVCFLSCISLCLSWRSSAFVNLNNGQKMHHSNHQQQLRTSCLPAFMVVASPLPADTVNENATKPPDSKGKKKKKRRSPPHDKKIRNNNISNARMCAVRAIVNSSKGGFPVDLLKLDPSYRSLDQRDRSFARLILATVERKAGQIDKVLRLCMKMHPRRDKHQTLVMACLRIGAAQLLFLRKPHYAVIQETVELVRALGGKLMPEPKIKFVNAVLRKISQEGSELLSQTTLLDNIAPWLVKEFQACWGENATELIVAQAMEEPACDLTTNVPYSLPLEEREKDLERIRSAFGDGAILLPTGSIRVGKNLSGSIANWPLYGRGHWWVQDVSASLPALALYNALLAKYRKVENLHVLDMCAAPGGKTAQLVTSGYSTVTAVEQNPRRSRRLIENLNRLKMVDKCKVVVSRGQEYVPDNNKPFDGILLDVPCSATGTGSKRPDLLHRTDDLGNLQETQQELANYCADNLLPVGGIMVYATCSLLKRESEEQIVHLLNRSPEPGRAVMRTLPFATGEISGFDGAIDENGWIRVLPGSLPGDLRSCDGFFVARLERVS